MDEVQRAKDREIIRLKLALKSIVNDVIQDGKISEKSMEMYNKIFSINI